MSRPFLLLATQRTGSTVLWRSLDDHPALHVRGEMFMQGMTHPESWPTWCRRPDRRLAARWLPGLAIPRYLDHFFAARDGVEAIGFKLMYSQARDEIWRWAERHDAAILHLVRRNPLKILVSKAAAEATGRRHAEPGEAHETQPVLLEADTLVARLDRITTQVAAHRQRIEGLRHLEIAYESLLSSPQALFDRCHAFLGVEPRGVELALRKLTSDDAQDAIANYTDVEDALRGTPYAELLRDEPQYDREGP